MTELRTAARKADEWATKRDHLIIAARSEGETLRAVADASGFSHMGVQKLVARTADRADDSRGTSAPAEISETG
jgi:hypothetical protein